MTSDATIFGKKLEGFITSDDILGKDVIDSLGETLGVVEKVFIGGKNLDFAGIAIDKGLFKQGISIGKDYIDRVTEYAVILNTSIMFELKGKFVFDSEGEKLGTICKVTTYESKNVIQSLEIQAGMGRTLIVPADIIARVDESVILSVSAAHLKA